MSSRLRVSFGASGFGQTGEAVVGSFIWDTGTDEFSHVSITTCSGPYIFLPSVQKRTFAPPPPAYPTGSLIFFNFVDAGGAINFQLNYGDHAYSDPPIIPAPGFYQGVPFDIGGTGIGNIPGSGVVIVSEVL